MREIHYAGTSIRTNAEVADAITDYAGELARRDSSEMIEVPGMLADGTPGRFSLLIGPASQIVVSDAAEPDSELIDGRATLDEIARRREAMRAFPTTSREWEHESMLDEL